MTAGPDLLKGSQSSSELLVLLRHRSPDSPYTSIMQQFREPRPSYPYDDQTAAYTGGHTSHHLSEYSLTTPAYPHYDSSNFYSSSAISGMSDTNPSSYYRNMSPSLSHSRYPSSSREPRYFSSESQGVLASSDTGSSLYSSNNGYFCPTFGPNGEARTQFIPTPSEMANTYSNYALVPRSSPLAASERYGSPTAYPAHLVTSSHVGTQRPKISTARPRSGTLGSSPATSPSGERFPCEKCGKTFSRSHDRKRHHETQHLATPIIHRCRWCEKEFSRADSLKRHVDNGCDEAPGP